MQKTLHTSLNLLQRTKTNCDQSNDLSSWQTLPCVPPTGSSELVSYLWSYLISSNTHAEHQHGNELSPQGDINGDFKN